MRRSWLLLVGLAVSGPSTAFAGVSWCYFFGPSETSVACVPLEWCELGAPCEVEGLAGDCVFVDGNNYCRPKCATFFGCVGEGEGFCPGLGPDGDSDVISWCIGLGTTLPAAGPEHDACLYYYVDARGDMRDIFSCGTDLHELWKCYRQTGDLDTFTYNWFAGDCDGDGVANGAELTAEGICDGRLTAAGPPNLGPGCDTSATPGDDAGPGGDDAGPGGDDAGPGGDDAGPRERDVPVRRNRPAGARESC